ncbi:hypothetical protein SO802_005225 [Lithocarpus litseifolius]|uniref:Putative plant transposon protein domain-containing protein n=1 Tax=Lithocarpus litseifolius TaxID=425828 RepID=A0AAW2DHL1_9ROSI
MPRKTRAHRTSDPSPSFETERFPSESNQVTYETLNLRRHIWAELRVVLDEVDPEVRRNFTHRGWLPLLEYEHSPPPATLIREFYSNLSIHVYDNDTLVKVWLRGVEYRITLRVVSDALGVPIVDHPVFPYEESPPLDDVLSYITGSSIQWGSDPRITSAELYELHYLFFRIACHSLWPISHVHTIPLERCVFLYALVTDAPISFPHLFLRSLNEVHRSSSTAHALFFLVFIHRILLFLGFNTHAAGTSSDPAVAAAADVPPPVDEVSDLRRTLDTVVTVQAAHGQLLVDILDELRALRVDLASSRHSPPPPFDDE